MQRHNNLYRYVVIKYFNNYLAWRLQWKNIPKGITVRPFELTQIKPPTYYSMLIAFSSKLIQCFYLKKKTL